MNKKIIAILLLLCLILLILPVKSYAVAAGTGIIVGGTAYAAGTYTYATLPPTVQGIIDSTAKDYHSQLFPSRSNIVLLDPKNGVGGGGNNNKQPTTPPTMWAVITTLIVNAVYEIKEVGDDAYELLVDIIQDEFSDYQPTVAELEVAKDIVERSVDCVNKTDFGNKPLSCLGFSTYSTENAFEILDNAGLIDDGKSIFERLKQQYSIDGIYSLNYNEISFNNASPTYPNVYYIILACPDPTSAFMKYMVYFNVNLKVPSVEFFYNSSNDTISYRPLQGDTSKIYTQYSGYHTDVVYAFVFSGANDNECRTKYVPFQQDLVKNNISILDGDLESTEGINAPIESDIEKAAKALADQLGVDLSKILNEYKVVIDENGNKYLESTVGIRTAVEELIKAYNESVSGNTAIINNLQKILDQLKGQDISGLEGIVSQINKNIDDLNNRDKSREEVYSNISETLTQVKTQLEKNYIDPEIINDINKNIADISAVVSPLSEPVQIDEDKLKAPASITTKFPFSLPFDIYHIFNVFSADPVTPEFDVPIDMSTVGGDVYNVHIDLSQFDFLAEIVRWLLYAVFIAGLIILTNRLIGRG